MLGLASVFLTDMMTPRNNRTRLALALILALVAMAALPGHVVAAAAPCGDAAGVVLCCCGAALAPGASCDLRQAEPPAGQDAGPSPSALRHPGDSGCGCFLRAPAVPSPASLKTAAGSLSLDTLAVARVADGLTLALQILGSLLVPANGLPHPVSVSATPSRAPPAR